MKYIISKTKCHLEALGVTRNCIFLDTKNSLTRNVNIARKCANKIK